MIIVQYSFGNSIFMEVEVPWYFKLIIVHFHLKIQYSRMTMVMRVPVGSVETAKEKRGDKKETTINDGVPAAWNIIDTWIIYFWQFLLFDLSSLVVPRCEASLGCSLKYGKIIFTFRQNIWPTTQMLSAASIPLHQLKITLAKVVRKLEAIWRNGLNNGNDPQ